MVTWSDEDLDWFEGTKLKWSTKYKNLISELDYQTLEQSIPGYAQKYSEEEFMETIRMVGAKSFVVRDGYFENRLMIPFADLINRRNIPNVSW